MECKFMIGQKIVYLGNIHELDGYVAYDYTSVTHPAKCGIYTVRELLLCPKNNAPMVRVKEIRNPLFRYCYPWGNWEVAWYHKNFRALEDLDTKEENKTDITLFKQILAEATKEASKEKETT